MTSSEPFPKPDRPLQATRQTPVDSVLGYVAELPRANQLELYARLGEHLAAEPVRTSNRDRRIERQCHALQAIARTARALNLPDGQAPTATQFADQARRLDVGLSVSSVGRAFGSWSDAARAYTTGQRPESRRPFSHRRHFERSVGRTPSDHLADISAWLNTQPAEETPANYTEWQRIRNESLADGDQPLAVSWRTLRRTFPGLTTNDLIASALGHVPDIRALQRQRAAEQLAHENNPLKLVSTDTAAALLGLTDNVVRDAVRSRRAGFPAAVAILAGTQLLYESDVQEYAARRIAPNRPHGELQSQLLGHERLSERLGVTKEVISKSIGRKLWHRIPPPTGRAGKVSYWTDDDVTRWLDEHRER